MYDVTLLAGWGGECLWFSSSHTPRLQHPVSEAAELLSLSDELARDISAWDGEYQSILNRAVPQDSAWPSQAAEEAWLERGKRLAARIKRDSPVVARVEYLGDGEIADGTYVF